MDVLFRHKWKILIIATLITAGVVVYTYAIPEIYRSEAQVLILPLGRESLSPDPALTGPLVPVFTNRESEIVSELAIFKSRTLIEKVIDDVGEDGFLERPDKPGTEKKRHEIFRIARYLLRTGEKAFKGLLARLDLIKPLAPREKAIKEFEDNLLVEVERKSSIINVSLDSQSAETSQTILDHLINLYLEHHIQVHSSQASPEFFERQTEELRASLADSEAALDTFKRENGIVSIEDQKKNLLESITVLEKDLYNMNAEVGATEARLAAFEKDLTGHSKTQELARTTGKTNFAADTLKDKLRELRLEEIDLATRYQDTHRPLVELREQIKNTEAALASEEETRTEVTVGINPNYQEIKLNIATERAQLKSKEAARVKIEAALREKESSLKSLTANEAKLNQLTRAFEISEKEYREYLDNLRRSKIAAALDHDKASNVSIVQPASLPLMPIRPNKPLNVALGILMGLFAGLLVAFILDYLDDTINSQADIEKRLNVPVLAVVSHKEFKSCT